MPRSLHPPKTTQQVPLDLQSTGCAEVGVTDGPTMRPSATNIEIASNTFRIDYSPSVNCRWLCPQRQDHSMGSLRIKQRLTESKIRADS